MRNMLIKNRKASSAFDNIQHTIDNCERNLALMELQMQKLLGLKLTDPQSTSGQTEDKAARLQMNGKRAHPSHVNSSATVDADSKVTASSEASMESNSADLPPKFPKSQSDTHLSSGKEDHQKTLVKASPPSLEDINRTLVYRAAPPRNSSSSLDEQSGGTSRKTSYSHLHLSQSDMEMTSTKVSYKIASIKAKLDVEKRVQAGAEKMHHLFSLKLGNLNSDERKAFKEVESKLKESAARIAVLRAALDRYNALDNSGVSSPSEDSDCESIVSAISERKSASCQMKITVINAHDVLGSYQAVKQEGYVMIRIDGVQKACTKTKSKYSWNEKFSILADKAHEIEFSVYNSNNVLVGLQFFRIADLIMELKSFDAANKSGDVFENYWDIEPTGQIGLRFKLNSADVQRAKSEIMAGLQRNAGVKRRKIHMVQGHKFVSKQFYAPMKCALCQEYIITRTACQCESCRFMCHKKCFPKVVTQCISRADDATEVNQHLSSLLKHNVPHRLEHVPAMVPHWCAHCGYMVPLGSKKNCLKCTECSIMCHADCKIYVPNFCGLSIELANQLIAESIEVEKKRQKALKGKGVSQELIIQANESTNALNKLLSTPHLRKVKIDDFHFIAVLGKGNFGKVMLAEEKVHHNLFAVKILKKEFILENEELESIRAEKRVFMTINNARHPFLVGLHACFQSEERLYFVMDYISGGDLMWHIQRQQFSEQRAKLYACEILLALEFFHQHDVVYRDLKLDNILLTPDGHVKLADYGLCKEAIGFGVSTNTFCGTPEFMAPEILLEKDYTRAVDWWAFGVLIYEMLLGQAPFKGHDEDEIFQAILEEEVVYPTRLQKDAKSIVQGLLTKKPKDRFGAGPADAADIKAHSYFAGVNWDDVYDKRVSVPFIPKISHPRDVSNFDQEFTNEVPVMTPVDKFLDDVDQAEFTDFNYISDWVNSQGFLDPYVPSKNNLRNTEAAEKEKIAGNEKTLPPRTSSMDNQRYEMPPSSV